MKRLLLGCLSVLALALAFHLGSATGRSEYVDPTAVGIVSMWAGNSNTPMVLDDGGTVWQYYATGHYWIVSSSVPPIPVSVSEVKFWNPWLLVTHDNHVWRNSWPGWQDLGVWPGGATPVQEESWGKIKSEFR